MLKTLVKVNQVTNLAEARYCAGMGVEMLGFSLDATSDTFVDAPKFTEIKNWLAGIQVVGETQSSDIQQIKSYLADYSLDLLQISDSSLLPEILDLDIPLILHLSVGEVFQIVDLDKYAQKFAYFLVEGKENEVLALQKQFTNYPILFQSDVQQLKLESILGENLLKGLAFEANNFDELKDILELLEEE